MFIELTDADDVKYLVNLDMVRKISPLPPDGSGDTKTKTSVFWAYEFDAYTEVQEDCASIKSRLSALNAIVP